MALCIRRTRTFFVGASASLPYCRILHRSPNNARHSCTRCYTDKISLQCIKNTTMALNSRRPIDAWRAGKWWKLRDSNLSASMQEKHLGLIRDPSCKENPAISENIQKATRSCYALMGAGMHGVNGTHPVISMKLWRTCALPQLIHGLELFRLTANNIKKLEICQNRTLMMILTLPNSTATCAVHLLSAIPPVQATIERSTLVLCRSLISNKNSK